MQNFQYRGRELPYMRQGHNCYHAHVKKYTERIVEIPIADSWLARMSVEGVIEVGAVTPYYWPGRVKEIIDPCDTHPQVTQKKRLEDVVPLFDKNVICISTLEHLGKGDEYGQKEDKSLAWLMMGNLVFGCRNLLATWPIGYNDNLDAFALKLRHPGVTLTCLVRDGDNWHESKPAIREYGPHFANAIFIVEKESVDNTPFQFAQQTP